MAFQNRFSSFPPAVYPLIFDDDDDNNNNNNNNNPLQIITRLYHRLTLLLIPYQNKIERKCE
jgi:hypothetical protein